MNNFINYDKLKNQIESKLCPEHSKHPIFTKTSEGFTINACCEKFRTSLIEYAEKAIEEEVQKSISEMLNKAFKK